MASKREELLQYLVSEVDAVGKPTGLAVDRERNRPLQVAGLPAVGLYLLREEVAPGDGRSPRSYKVVRAATLRAEVRAAITDADDPTTPDAALDPYLSWVVQRVMRDRTQGGRAKMTYERQTQWTAEEGDALFAAAAVDFTIEYITSAVDPDAA